MSTSTTIRASERVTVPWKNGLGLTSEVLASPHDATVANFDWRISIATIDTDSEFSSFVGIDRMLMPLDEGGLVLRMNGILTPLDRYAVATFAGEDDVAAVEVGKRSSDLNLMVKRGSCTGTLEAAHLSAPRQFGQQPAEGLSPAHTVLIVLEGEVLVTEHAPGGGVDSGVDVGDAGVGSGVGGGIGDAGGVCEQPAIALGEGDTFSSAGNFRVAAADAAAVPVVAIAKINILTR